MTLTAPGAAPHRRWSIEHSARREACDCYQRGRLDVWNESAGRRWNTLRTSLSRLWPGMAYFRAVEVQQRGALHLHVLLALPEGVEVDLGQVQEAALSAGFGCVMDWAPLDSPIKAARYVSKYVTKAASQRLSVPWLRSVPDLATGEVLEVTRPSYRSWSVSHAWGCSMRDVLEGIRASQARSRSGHVDLPDEPPARPLAETAAGPP